jgi:hypothetical protein
MAQPMTPIAECWRQTPRAPERDPETRGHGWPDAAVSGDFAGWVPGRPYGRDGRRKTGFADDDHRAINIEEAMARP